MRAVSGAMDHLVWRRRADDALCVTDRNREWTYREFTACVDAAAAQLAAAGVRAGSVVAIVMANSAELLMALMAVWRVGAVAAPVDPAAGRARAEREVGAVGAVLVLDDMPVPGLPRRLGGASCISAEGLAPGGAGGGGGAPAGGGGGAGRPRPGAGAGAAAGAGRAPPPPPGAGVRRYRAGVCAGAWPCRVRGDPARRSRRTGPANGAVSRSRCGRRVFDSAAAGPGRRDRHELSAGGPDGRADQTGSRLPAFASAGQCRTGTAADEVRPRGGRPRTGRKPGVMAVPVVTPPGG